MTSVATSLDTAEEKALVEFLGERWEMFTWRPANMPGVRKELAKHALNIYMRGRPVTQSLWHFKELKRKAIFK
jgi:hypothetical protein